MACQHFPDDQTLWLQTGAGEGNIIHLPSGLDHVDCERQEEEKAKKADVLTVTPRVTPIFFAFIWLYKESTSVSEYSCLLNLLPGAIELGLQLSSG